MRKLILKWLFGTDNMEDYFDLLCKKHIYLKECIELLDDHIKTLKEYKEDLINIRKLIKICENHGIDVNKEIKNIEL